MTSVNRKTFDEVMVANYAPSDIIPVRGQGARIWDQDGREYVDFACGIAVTLLGHCHPRLVAALTEQANRLWHLSNVMTNEPALRLASRLCELTFADRVYFCNSGGEANEAAFKLARRWGSTNFGPQKHEIVAFDNAFHGRTLFTVSVGGQAKYTQGFEPLPGGIHHVPFNDLSALEKVVSRERTCAIVMELVQGEGGVLPATPEFARGVRALCDANDALLVYDEVQTGLGRTGSLFAYMDYGVTPDVLTAAKGLGGGYPVGAMLATAQCAAALPFGTHGSTFGGNPLACAVAGAVLDELEQPGVLEGVHERAATIRARLEAIGAATGMFEEVRGKGLLIGAPLSERWKGRGKEIVKAGLANGVWCLVAGPDVLRVAPSLVIPESDLAEGLDRLEVACRDVASS